jgi:hypothetical protein
MVTEFLLESGIFGHFREYSGTGGREKTRFGANTRSEREAQKMWGILGQIRAFGGRGETAKARRREGGAKEEG